jgi:hypothetical protein
MPRCPDAPMPRCPDAPMRLAAIAGRRPRRGYIRPLSAVRTSEAGTPPLSPCPVGRSAGRSSPPGSRSCPSSRADVCPRRVRADRARGGRSCRRPGPGRRLSHRCRTSRPPNGIEVPAECWRRMRASTSCRPAARKRPGIAPGQMTPPSSSSLRQGGTVMPGPEADSPVAEPRRRQRGTARARYGCPDSAGESRCRTSRPGRRTLERSGLGGTARTPLAGAVRRVRPRSDPVL